MNGLALCVGGAYTVTINIVRPKHHHHLLFKGNSDRRINS